ncbi:MAG: preprotein translocase subunit YajC [Oscillospiraceae bacterium]|nr:preprotein translocase subunit YajC [Oscillospiraceae bacterium]
MGSAAGGEQGGLLQMLITLAPLLLVFVVMYFMMIRPQRKREKEIEKMRAELEVGDEVITSGGVVGLVVSLREDSVTIETGSDRSKIRVMRWAIQKNNTIHD